MIDQQTSMTSEIGDDFLCRDSTRNLFDQPDDIVIHEYLHVYRSNSAHTPEIRLIAAVLQDAIDCYLKYHSAKTRRGKRIFTEAEQWIFSQDDDWLFGFDNICEMLKLDPVYIRQILKEITEERAPQCKLPGQLAEAVQPIALRLAS